MSDRDEASVLPTKEEKLDYVLASMSRYMDLFELEELQLVNQDPINLTIKFQKTKERMEAFESLEGFELNESSIASVRHRFDEKTAVSTNICVDKARETFILSMNF